MNEITKDELCANGAGGSDLCDVAGAWLVCAGWSSFERAALVAAIALAVSGDLQPPPASTPVATSTRPACAGTSCGTGPSTKAVTVSACNYSDQTVTIE